MHDVFIAHVEADSDIALKIAFDLEQEDYRTWTYEVDSIPGPSYLVQTGQAVEDAKAVIVIISPHSINSRQVTKEVVRAHEAGKEFIPVRRDISHEEFQTRQPEWREAIGAASSLELIGDDVEGVALRISDGLKAMGILPRAGPDTNHLKKIRNAQSKLSGPGAPEKPGAEAVTAETAPAGTLKEAGRRSKWVRTALIVPAAIVVVIVVVVIIIIGGGNGESTPPVVPPAKYSLSIAVSPTGGGTIRPESGDYDEGSEVTLTATPSAGYTFDHWSGDITGTTTTATLLMEADRSVVALFMAEYTLTTMVSPDGSGTVTPAGGNYDEDSEVTLTASPLEGYVFDYWSGAVDGTSETVPLIMDSNKNIIAHFKEQYNLSVSVSPEGAGTVTPAGGLYVTGTELTFTAAPAEGFMFYQWSGDIMDTASSVTLNIDSDKNITAYFSEVLFEDQFNDNTNGWSIDDDRYISNGVYNTTLSLDPGARVSVVNYRWPNRSPDFADFGFEIDVITIHQDEEGQGRGITFLCDPAREETNRPQHQYLFLISGNGAYILIREIDDDSMILIPWTETPYLNEGNATNRLKVICRDATIEIYINGHLIESFSGEFPEDVGDNGIGVFTKGVDGTHIAFDNIKMWTIPTIPGD